MLKWIETTGKTEDAAIEAALVQLGMDRDEVSVEVLARAKSGFLGIGSSPAKVKVTYEVPDEPEKPPVVKTAPPEKKPERRREQPPRPKAPEPVRAQSATKSSPAPAPTPAPAAAPSVEPEEDRTEKIMQFLTGLLAHMGSDAKPVVRLDEEGIYQVELTGEHLGGLIGRRGETLDAIQQLASYSVNRGRAKRVRIHVDAEGYRAKREESLVRLARKVAGKVSKSRRNVTLEPMNAYERHVIHAALQDYPDITTYSVGSEPNRRTVVAYGRGERR